MSMGSLGVATPPPAITLIWSTPDLSSSRAARRTESAPSATWEYAELVIEHEQRWVSALTGEVSPCPPVWERTRPERNTLGLITGPRVFRSGRVLSQTGGHGDTSPVSADTHLCSCSITSSAYSHVADGADSVRRAAREELKSGVDQIKVMAGGGVATPSDPIDMVQYTEEEIRAAVEEAAARRTYVLAHAYIPEAIARAVRAGVRSIEHGNLLDSGAARLMGEHGCFLVPTLVTYDQLAAFGRDWSFPAESLAKLDAVKDAGLAAVDIAASAGVRIGFGTDLLGETHDAQSREFILRTQVQNTAEVLRSATTVNAELLGKPGELGVISPGAFADLLLVDGNPLADLSILDGQGEHLDLIT